MLVIDDHLLLDILAGNATPPFADEARARPCTQRRAGTTGSPARLSKDPARARCRVASTLSDPDRQEVRARLLSLPDPIGMIGPRTLVPVMAALRTPRRLNFLSSEALAVAILTESSIAVRTDSPPLREACAALRVTYRVIEKQ